MRRRHFVHFRTRLLVVSYDCCAHTLPAIQVISGRCSSSRADFAYANHCHNDTFCWLSGRSFEDGVD